MNRRGFALIAVLWLVTLVSSVVGLGIAGSRLGQRTSFNRIALARGRWAAEACLSITQTRWRQRRLADTATIDLGRDVRCVWRIHDPGTRIDANTADRELLARLLGDSAHARAIVDARQAAAFVSDQQLPLDARGFLTVDGSGVVNLSGAPARVLAALPGMTAEAVDRVLARRTIGRPVASLDELAGLLSPSARAALLARYAELARLAVFAPARLIVTAEGWWGGAGARATIEVVAVPLPDRLAVIRRRMW